MFITEIRRYVDIAREHHLIPTEMTIDSLSPNSPVDRRLCSDSFRGLERGSSLSEESRVSDGSTRFSGTEQDPSQYVLSHIPMWLGFATGALRYLSKNGKENGSMMM